MNSFIALVIHTANILGSFQDPFEFQGDYGPEINPIREQVFELVVSKEALAKNLSDFEVEQIKGKKIADRSEMKEFRQILVDQAKEGDSTHGPTLSELVTPDLIDEFSKIQEHLQGFGFSKKNLEDILDFIEKYGDNKIFYFFRNAPSDLLNLDKALHDKSAREGNSFNLPILGSTYPLKGRNAKELKSHLLQQLFNKENFNLSKAEGQLRAYISEIDPHFLHPFFGENADAQDLQAFTSPAGQIFFYWLYQSLNLQLVSENPVMIDEINRVKGLFAQTLGNPKTRAESFKEKLITAGSGIVFTQEADAFVPQALLKEEFFLPVEKQNQQDGTLIFLRSDLWEPDYQIVPLESYEGYVKGRVNVILATNIAGEKFLLASAHGNSTRAEDGRLQVALVMEKFEEMVTQNKGLQLIIGIDANTKTEEDVQMLREHLDMLGLIGTNVGPTTIKQRMVTSQHAKAGRMAIDEEDYLIVLKSEKGGRYCLTNSTVGFKEEKPAVDTALPNVNNPSDHYPVGAILLLQK